MSKTTLVIQRGDGGYNHERFSFDNGDDVILQETDGSGDYLRGFSADRVLLMTELEPSVINRVIKPMVTMTDGYIVHLY